MSVINFKLNHELYTVLLQDKKNTTISQRIHYGSVIMTIIKTFNLNNFIHQIVYPAHINKLSRKSGLHGRTFVHVEIWRK